MVMPWPPQRPSPSVRPDERNEANRCAYCHYLIRLRSGWMISDYWETVEELAPGVALPVECSMRPKPGCGPGAFFQHTPVRQEPESVL